MSQARDDIIQAIDALCWDARRLGHDDYGLDEDFADTYTTSDCSTATVHPGVVGYVDRMIAEGVFDTGRKQS